MTALLRQLDVQFGLHADVNDFTTAPVTFRRLQVTGGAESLMPRRLMEISRNDIASLDGRGFVHLYGPLDLADLAPVTEFKGINTNDGAAVAAAGWAAKMEQADLLTSMFGSLPIATTSAAPTVAASGHTTTTLTTAGTAPVAGEFFLFQTSAGPVIRQVFSVVGQIATFDRSYAGTPTSASTIIRAARWVWDASVRNHVHMGAKVEVVGSLLATFLGLAPVSCAIAIPTGGKLTATWAFSPSDVDGFAAPAAPTPTPPTAGTPIVGLNAVVMIGNERFFADSISLTINTGNEPRTTPATENGVAGGIQAEKRGNGLQLTFSIRNESNLRGGVERNAGSETLRTLAGDTLGAGALSTSRDVLLVVGRSAGAALALRIGSADTQVTMATVGATQAITVTCTATDSASFGVF
jgi:hypothetical protein